MKISEKKTTFAFLYDTVNKNIIFWGYFWECEEVIRHVTRGCGINKS